MGLGRLGLELSKCECVTQFTRDGVKRIPGHCSPLESTMVYWGGGEGQPVTSSVLTLGPAVWPEPRMPRESSRESVGPALPG